MAEPVCVISGVGPGTGTAFVRRFASEGYRIAMLGARLSGRRLALRCPRQRLMSGIKPISPISRFHQWHCGMDLR